MQGDFDSTGLSGGIVVDVEVGGFVEAVEEWATGGCVEVDVDVGVSG